MLSAVFVSFFLLLLAGVPVVCVVLGSSSLGILMSGTNPVILVQQLFEGINKYTLLAVPFFIISGDIAAKGDTSQRIVNAINVFLGRIYGGLGIATVFACVFFGAITGSSVATVVAIGALMMPKLLDAGYPKALVVGLITTAGTIGVMIPPSVPMITISVAMNMSVGKLFTAGFVPGFLTAAVFSVYVAFVAKKHGIKSQTKIPWSEKMGVLKDSFFALMFPVIVLGSIYSGIATPTEAAIISLFYVIAVELFVYKKVSLKEIFEITGKSAVNAATLTLVIASAQVFVWFMTTAHLPEMVYNTVTGMFTNKLTLMFALCILFFIVGCFTNVATFVAIMGPILLGVLTYFEIDLIYFGIICIMMAQIGFVTPPFGLCLFIAMKVTKSSMVEVTKACVPFLLLMFIITVLLVLFPSISTFLPNLLFP